MAKENSELYTELIDALTTDLKEVAEKLEVTPAAIRLVKKGQRVGHRIKRETVDFALKRSKLIEEKARALEGVLQE